MPASPLPTAARRASGAEPEARRPHIPKLLHFCFGMARNFGEKPWGLVHYACVRSAVERIKPAAAYLYYEHEPRGPWWSLTRDMVTPVKIRAPRAIFGNPLPHPAHRADVVRLEKLLEFGGIYLDCDVFVHRDFDDLLSHSMVLGRQGSAGRGDGLCNAVICAEAGAPFLRRWHAEYTTFRSRGLDDYWDEHSTRIPLRLSTEFAEEVTVVPAVAFFWPAWEGDGVARIFGSTEPVAGPASYANHLWESCAWEQFLEDLTPGRVRRLDSNFHFWARPMVATLPDDYGAPSIIAPVIRRVGSGIRRGGSRLARSLARRLRRPAAPRVMSLR